MKSLSSCRPGHPGSLRFAVLLVSTALTIVATVSLAQAQGTDGVVDPNVPTWKAPTVAPSIEHGIDLPLENVTVLKAIDPDRLFAQDEQRAADDKILRFGVRRETDVRIDDGKWHPILGVGVLWTIDIVSEDAIGMRLHFEDVALPDGAQIYVYDPADPSRVFVHGNPTHDNGRDFWGRTTFGSRTRVEYFLPDHIPYVRQDRPFRIDAIQHLYRDPVALTASAIAFGGPGCHNDVSCYPAYADIAKSVGGTGFIVGDSLFCTGQLLSTTGGDLTPYFLTANHCIDTQSTASTTEIYWMYQTPSCGGAVPALSTVPQSAGCTLLSTSTTSDYTLMMIDGALPGGLFWSGWEASSIAVGTDNFGVHHPQGTYKRISFGDVDSGAGFGFVRSDWNDGPTEPGSSGSGLWRDSDQRLIGQLCCGISGCGSLTWDDYGAFSVTYPNISSFLVDGSDDGFDDNDSCAAAVAIAPGTHTDLVVKSLDEDWYRVSFGAGESIEITADFVDADGDIDMQLFSACGGSAVASATSGSNDEVINYTNPGGAADFFLRVFLASDTRNSYNLAVGGGGGGTGPINDSCVNAIAVANGTFGFDSTGATTDGPTEPTLCTFFSYTDVGSDIWYCYTAPLTGDVTVSLCGSGYDTKLAVYAGCGCPAPDSAIFCNDDSCGLQSELTFAAQSGDTFMIRIGGYNGATGSGALAISTETTDDCASAIAVSEGVTLFDTTGATTDGPDEAALCTFFSYTQIGSDVWFSYTATCTGDTTVSLCGSSYDTKMAVYAGASCPVSASALVCNDDFCALQSEVSFSATSGQTYLIRVGGYNGATGSGMMDISCVSTNDDCVNADVVFDGTTAGTLVGGTHDGESSCGITSSSPDVWYVYTASCTGMVHISTCGTSDIGGTDAGIDTVLSVHTGCPGTTSNEVDCNDDWPAGSGFDTCTGIDVGLARDSAVSFSVTAGEVLYIRVAVYGAGAPGPFNLSIDCAALAAAGDNCTAPITIGAGAHGGTLIGATNDGTASCGSSDSSADVWYSYTATCDGTVLVNTCGTHDLGGVDTGTDTVLSVHSGCPGSPGNELACNDDWVGSSTPTACSGVDAGDSRDSAVAVSVVNGETLLIRVSHFATSFAAPFNLNVEQQCDCDPVFALSCTEAGGDVDLNWSNGEAYDLIRVYRDGSQIALISGSTTGYTDSSPGAGTFAYTVRGECAGMLADPVGCSASIGCDSVTGLSCGSVGDDIQLDWTNGDSYTLIRVTRGGAEIAVIGGSETSFTDTSLSAGTYVYTVRGECGAVLSTSASCVHMHACNPISGLSCVVAGGDVDLSWSLGGAYSSISVSRDGAFLAVLGGAATSYTDSGVLAGSHTYQISVDCGGLVAPDATCDVAVGCDSVTSLDCSSIDEDVVLGWTNAEVYSEITITRTGSVIAILPGTATSYTDVSVAAGSLVYGVTATCAGVDASATSCLVSHSPVTPGDFRRGDCNNDGGIDISDAVSLLAFLFDPLVTTVACGDACDTNDDGAIDIADAVNALDALFLGGFIPAPSPGCGTDPSPDGLDCAVYTGCP